MSESVNATENTSIKLIDDIEIQLTQDESRKLSQPPGVTEFQRQKFDREAKRNWDLFYKRNGNRFFKNRYWTRQEFRELFDSDGCSEECKYLLEIGCGCGDFVLPLLEHNDSCFPTQSMTTKNLFIYCCDISDKAIEILQKHPIYQSNSPHKIKAFTLDISSPNVEHISSQLDDNLMDIVSLIFVLSTLEPSKLSTAIENIYRILKPGGLVLFRDYAIYDKAMLRFSDKSKICDQFYVRQDGTRAHFFIKEQLEESFRLCNFKTQSIEYVKRETINNATKDKFTRIFLQAKFTKAIL